MEAANSQSKFRTMNGQKNRICRGPPEADEWKKSDFGLQAFGHGFDQYKGVIGSNPANRQAVLRPVVTEDY
jgi:hypothetical protein